MPDRDRLLVDAMCGKLATHLRMCGYDAASVLDGRAEPPSDEQVLRRAREEGRRIVTRDRALAARAEGAVRLESRAVTAQLGALASVGFDLTLPEEPVRCSECNGPLEPTDRAEPTPEYAPDPAETAVWRCVDCGQHFWRGSHWDDVAATLASVERG